MENRRAVIITDLHGCLDEARDLLARLDFRQEEDLLINLGDTIDRGTQIYEVFEFFRDLKEQMGDRCVLIRGNHEQMMLDSALPDPVYKKLWYLNSGEKTVYSFISHKHRIQEFRSWYEAMPYYYQDPLGRFIAVHASLTDEDPEKNSVETMIWGRETDYYGRLIITGHTPYRNPLYMAGEGRYAILEPHRRYRLEERGIIALDTGCVFGNKLSGMVIEGDTFYVASVEAKKRNK